MLVNDVHSKLNSTHVRGVARPRTVDDLVRLVRQARRANVALSVCGGRHAMGGQQFGCGTVLIDTSAMIRVLGFDEGAGLIEVEAGIQWPELIGHLRAVQARTAHPWSIVQKQTGADRLSLGGSLSANVHGRGLTLRPIVADVESLTLVDAQGELRSCSRSENPDLFALAIGGYGLFGVIATVTLRLMPRRKLERLVELRDVAELGEAFERRIAEGCRFGDFQFSTDVASRSGLRRGVLSCYRPVDDAVALPPRQRELGREHWQELLRLAHTDRQRAFEVYAAHYLATAGQIYESDTHQLALYLDDYHEALDRRLGASVAGSEMISELYVPRTELAGFLERVRADFRAHAVPLVYGTVRLIERDTESFLAWALQPWACVVFNLHVDHQPSALKKSATHFRRLIDRALERGGSFYLTYHHWATRQQVAAGHPRFRAFLAAKRRCDPEERFQSDWYRHYRTVFAEDTADTVQAAGVGL